MKAYLSILLIVAFFAISLEAGNNQLIIFENVIKNNDKYNKISRCLMNLSICNEDGMVLKGILYDVLNHAENEYVTMEINPVIRGLQYLKEQHPEDFGILMKIYLITKKPNIII